jgi:hypothetical protein
MKIQFSKKRFLTVVTLFVLAIALVVFNQLAIVNSMGNQFPIATPTPPFDTFNTEIENIQKELNNPKIDKDIRSTLENKIKDLTELQASIGKITPWSATLEPPMALGTNHSSENTKIPPMTGIIDYHIMLPERKDLVMENAWQEIVNDEYLTVLAGYVRNDPDQGELCFRSDTIPLTCIDTPNRSGSIKIIEQKIKERKLILTSKKGNSFYFDIPGKKFAKSLDEIIPTATMQALKNIVPTISLTPQSGYPAP